MARLQRSRRSLRQHRRIEHEVLRRDDRRATLAEQTCHVASREPTAEDERATERIAVCHGLPLHGREVFHEGTGVVAAATILRNNVLAPALSSISLRLPHFGLCTH